MAITGASYGLALAYYTIVLVACAIFFGIMRRVPSLRPFYQPRWCACPHPCSAHATSHIRSFARDTTRFKSPQMLPSWAGIMSWIPPVAFFDQLTIYEYSGIDGLVMIRMLYFALRLFLVLGLLCNVVLLPVYLTGNNIDTMLADPNTPVDTYGTIDRVGFFFSFFVW